VNSEAKEQLDDDGDGSTSRITKGNSGTRSFSPDFNSTKVRESRNVVNIMVDRLKALHEDELASLAVIVATSGLNAVLDRGKCHQTGTVNGVSSGSLRPQSRRYSSAASFVDAHGINKESSSELPSLDKFLVKHLSKLEREVQEAREASNKPSSHKHVALDVRNNTNTQESADLGSILVNHMSKFEKEILEAKKKSQGSHPMEQNCKNVKVSAEIDVQSGNKESDCGKPQSVGENNGDLLESCDARRSSEESNHIQEISDYVQDDKENKISHSHQLPPLGAKSKQGGRRLTRIEAAKMESLKSFCTNKDGNTLDAGLDKIFVKPVHRLEKEKREARERQTSVQKHPQKRGQSTAVTVSLDDVLVKHVSRLEREKIEYKKRNALGGWINVPHDQRRNCNNAESSESLDQVLVKHVSRLEREKMEYGERNALEGGGTDEQNNKQSNSATASDSLDQILVKHVSRLEKEKIELEKKGGNTHCTDEQEGSLADIFVKRPTKLEQAKLVSAAEEKSTSGLNPVEERRKTRERELLDAWGGMGLNSMKPQASKIERDKVTLVHCTIIFLKIL
jgi:hypothetical protein